MNFFLPTLAFSPLIFWAGAAATSIPIVIHLLNKRRFRIVIWAAMDWLLAAQRRNARKLKFQRWLLLALRVLAILLLALAIAQFTLASKVVAKVIGGGKSVVIVLDDSYSMGYTRGDLPSTFQRAKKLATDYLGTLDSGDKVLLIRTSEAAGMNGKLRPDARFVVAELRDAALSDSATDLATALTVAADAIKADGEGSLSNQVILLTDLSQSSIPSDAFRPTSEGAAGAKPAPLKAAAAKVKAARATLKVIDLGADDQVNSAVAEITMVQPIAVVDTAVQFEATVFNGTAQASIGAPLTLMVDGRVERTVKLGPIEPGKTGTIPLSTTFKSPGKHTVEVVVSPDLLANDDSRRLVVDVQRDIPMLIVDGAPGNGQDKWPSSQYIYKYSVIQSALAATVITDQQLGGVPIGKQKIIVFSDAAAPSDAAASALLKFVQDGGLLMVFPGEQTRSNATAWRDRMGSRGVNLLPSDFGQIEDLKNPAAGTEGVSLDPMDFAHPVLRRFGDFVKQGHTVAFPSAQTTRYMQLSVPTDGSVDVILRFKKIDGSAGGHPAVIAKQVGRGHVVQFAASADTAWWSFPTYANFIPFLDQLLNYELAGAADRFTLLVGQPLDLSPEASTPGRWNAPRNSKINVVRKPREIAETLAAQPASAPATSPATQPLVDRLYSDNGAPLKLAGFYGPEGSPPVVAVNVDSVEANIKHLSAAQFAGALGIEEANIVAQPDSLSASMAGSAENTGAGNWPRVLLFAALFLFVLETILARVFSVYR